MDRRVIAGIVGAVLAGSAPASLAQVGPDPSGMPPVGLSPLPSIRDTINAVGGFPDRVEVASPGVPTNPTASGPAAAPVAPGPVSLRPEIPIGEAIRSEYAPSRISPIGRGNRATAGRPSTRVAPQAAAAPPLFELRRAATPATRDDLLAEPAPLPDPPAGGSMTPPASPFGRPAPFARRAPGLARPQADPASRAPAGRPAPLATEQPREARPQPPADDRPPVSRPRASAPTSPTYSPAEPPAQPAPTPPPVEPDPAPLAPMPLPPPIELEPPPAAATPPPIELEPPPAAATPPPIELEPPPAAATPPPVAEVPSPPPAAATSPPIGTDPLQGVEPTSPVVPTGPTPAPAEPATPLPEVVPAADPELKRVSQDPTAMKLTDRPRELPFATRRAAAVGDEVITLDELIAVAMPRYDELAASRPMSEPEKRQAKNLIAAEALDQMIDQSVILQEAKREMKSAKAQTMFQDYVDKTWHDDELPGLLRKTASANEYELKKKLADEGKSYDAMKETYRKKMMAREFLGMKIRHKVTCDLAEQRAYYNEHLKDYDQPARFTWREIEVAIAKHPSRAAARQQADAILARLLHDEDFAAVARAASDGPTASSGGLYPDMTPGSYGIPAVNDELNRLPVGQISKILEAPGSFHIVRVESRREAGPLRFDEVQDKIKMQVIQRNHLRAVESYITKLRSRTLIRTMFDNTESDPGKARRNDAAVRPVSNR